MKTIDADGSCLWNPSGVSIAHAVGDGRRTGEAKVPVVIADVGAGDFGNQVPQCTDVRRRRRIRVLLDRLPPRAAPTRVAAQSPVRIDARRAVGVSRVDAAVPVREVCERCRGKREGCHRPVLFRLDRQATAVLVEDPGELGEHSHLLPEVLLVRRDLSRILDMDQDVETERSTRRPRNADSPGDPLETADLRTLPRLRFDRDVVGVDRRVRSDFEGDDPVLHPLGDPERECTAVQSAPIGAGSYSA